MTTDAILFTASFATATTPLPRAANAALTRIAPTPRRIPDRIAVCWTISLGDPGRRSGLHARSA